MCVLKKYTYIIFKSDHSGCFSNATDNIFTRDFFETRAPFPPTLSYGMSRRSTGTGENNTVLVLARSAFHPLNLACSFGIPCAFFNPRSSFSIFVCTASGAQERNLARHRSPSTGLRHARVLQLQSPASGRCELRFARGWGIPGRCFAVLHVPGMYDDPSERARSRYNQIN